MEKATNPWSCDWFMRRKTIKIKNKKLKAIDLFSGCGGLTQGLKDAGFNVVGAVENNKVFIETYSMNHGEVHVWDEDIKKVDPKKMMSALKLKRGELDLLAGCPPCQGFSTIGTKDSGDKRNDLVFEFLRLVEKFLPKAIMMENVPGLFKDGRMMKVLRRLHELGYDYGDTPAILNVAEYGVPQRRRRMILMAGRKGRINLAEKIGVKKTVREAIGSLKSPGQSGDPLHDYPEKRTEKVLKIIKKIPKDGGSRRKLALEDQLPCHQRCSGGFKDVYGRMRWDDVSPTITGGCTNPSKGRFLHPDQHRAITMREAALLQTFPMGYKFSLTGGKGTISLMIGNALPPEFIKRHAVRIKKYLHTHD